MRAMGERGASQYWNGVAADWIENAPQTLWRRHSDAVNAALVARWLPAEPASRLLKTDLFDEAVGQGLAALLKQRAEQVVGLDIAPRIAAEALRRDTAVVAICGDVRHLPFAAASFDAVISNSTLDHFTERDDIGVALGEICRVLRPGGRLLLTLDNAANPVLALRQTLPARWLRTLRITPYAVGATLGPRRLRRLLDTLPLKMERAEAVLHCPRALAVARANRQRDASLARQERLLQSLLRWERLADWPSRWWSGYYIAVLATRLDEAGVSPRR